MSFATCQGKYRMQSRCTEGSPTLRHWQSTGLGNPAPPGSEATREAGGLYADTLVNSTVPPSAVQIHRETL